MQKTPRRVLALVLAMIMALSVFSISASAAADNYRADYQSETHTVFKHTEQTLAPGVEYYNNYAYAKDGKQMVYYVTTADVNRDDVICQISYKDMQCDNYGMSKLSDQVAAANSKYSDPDNTSLNEYEKTAYANPNYAVVSATNGDGYNMSTGEPGGTLIMGGKIKKEWTKNASSDMFFAILKDGRAVIGDTKAEWDAYKADPGIAEAIDSFGSSARLVWDGVDTTASASGSYNTDRHSRTMLGVTADGKVVTAVLDGRQEPFSCGGSMHELAQIMLEAGCVRAFNCDGGGSTTFIARMPGDENATVVNRPSDGSPRSISNGIIIATTAKVKDEVAKVEYSPEAEYTTPGSSVKIGYVAYDEDNSPITRPSGLTFETTGGTFENGVFTAPETAGDVTITAKFDGNNVGEQVIHVIVPDSISFDTKASKLYVELGTSTPIPINASYNGGDVSLKPEDFEFSVVNTTPGYEGEEIGSFDGYIFNAPAKTEANIERYKSAALTVSAKGGTATASIDVSFEETMVVARDFEQTGMSSVQSAYSNQHEMASNYYATRETGKVKNGDYSMAVNIDFTQINETGYLAVNQFLTTSNKPDAQKVGMWIYIPENIPALWVRTLGTAEINFIPTGETYKEKYDTGAWHYFEADVSGYSTFAVSTMQIYLSDRDGADAGYYFKDATNVNNKFTLYFDDLTYDRTFGGYDFYEPVFGDITAYTASGATGVDLVRGSAADVNASTMSIVANVADDTKRNPYTVSGLDYSSAKAYIDGVAVDAKAANNTITIEDATLSAGVHTVRYEISDNNGTEAVIERQLNVTAGANSALKLVSRTPVDTKVLIGSVHWFDLVAEDISAIDSASITLDLDGFNNWQYKRIQCADGFSYTASVDDVLNTLTLNFTRTEGAPAGNTLASIPVKVWESTLTTYSGYESCTPANLFSRKIFWPIAIEIKPVLGSVNLVGGSKDSFSFEKFLIDTEIDGAYAKLNEEGYFADGKTSWHVHTLEWIEEPTDAACNHYGTTGIARCTVCDDIVYYDDSRVFTDHHYEWNIAKQKYVCKDCEKETDELPTIETAKASKGILSDGVVENGWVVTKDENNEYVYYYVEDGVKATGPREVAMYDGSGTFMLSFSTSPYDLKGKFTGSINAANYKCKVYDDGLLSTGSGDHIVTDGSKYWIVNKDGYTAYTGTATGFYVYEGKTYCIYGSKTSTIHGSLNGGLWTGPLNYSKNTTATEDHYYIRGVKIDGWTCNSGAAYDADGNLVTGWRNADGTPTTVDKDDNDSMVGKYYFGSDGKLVVSTTLVYFDDEKTFENARYISFGTKSGYLDNIGECEGFSETKSIISHHVYLNGFPYHESEFYSSSTLYTYMIINGVRQTSPNSSVVPIKAADGYYYNVKGTTGYVVSQYKTTSNYFGTGSSYNKGMEPYWIEGRYTGVINNGDEVGYAIFGQLYPGYSLIDGKVCDENGDPLNRSFVNGFGDNVFYKDGVQQLSGSFVVDGKAYTVVNEYGKAVPLSGIIDGDFYIDGVLSDNTVYADKYVVNDGKVCSINDDGSIGDPVNGIIGETYFVDGVANDYQIVDGLIKDGDKLYNIDNGMKGDAFNGIYNGVYYENGSGTEYTVIDGKIVVKDGKYYAEAKDGSLEPFNGISEDVYYANGEATEYQVIDGKYVFKDGILYNINYNGALSSRVTGTVDGTKYTSGKPQNGWVADKYFYENGKKVTGSIEIDGKAYKFNDEGELEGPYNGMLYDEANDVYRMYDQGVRKNGSDEFGTCVDGVPADGWYANEYYFVNGKFLTGIQEIDGYYYDFGENGSGNAYNKFSGLFEKDGGKYYAILGELASGWNTVGDDYYYFSPTDFRAVDGEQRINSVNYTFVDYVLTKGSWLQDGEDWLYMWAGRGHIAGWAEIDGKTYLFNGNGIAQRGVRAVSRDGVEKDYAFDDHGAWMEDYIGLYTFNGVTYYVENGYSVGGGLRLIDGNYYYFKSNKTAVKGTEYYISITNDLLPAGRYSFDENGVMQVESTPDPDTKNGIYEENGTLWYYENGAKKSAGLLQIDGKYYYVRSGGVVIANQSYYITNTNGLDVAAGRYEFDANGVMTVPEPQTEPDPDTKNGIYEENGTLWYYENGAKKSAGLLQIDGKYYYVRSGGVVIANQSYYITNTNGLDVAAGRYEFDANGVMTVPEPQTEPDPDTKNGIYEENGTLWYYENGAKKSAGLLQIDGKYYYVRSGGVVIANQSYYITNTNDLLPAGRYNFDADGVMQVD